MEAAFKQDFRKPYEPTPDPRLMEEIKGFNSNQIERLRYEAKYNRYFLAKGVLGYRDVNPYTHGPLCKALENTSKNRRMYLMPRGHLKTTLCTVTDEVGKGLADPEEYRGLILNEIESKSVGFLSEIKAHFENNQIIEELFPEIRPPKFGGPGSKWSTNQACLNRSTAYKEWTWTAAGVGSSLAGNHYKSIKCDDLIGFEARESQAAMRYAVAFAKTLEPLLIDMDEDFIDFVGTRWSLFDLYREMIRAYGADMAYFSRQDIEEVPELPLEDLLAAGFAWNGKGNPQLTDAQVLAKIGTQQPIFPRKFSLKQLERLSIIDPILYYAQYKNNPITDNTKDFKNERINFFDFDSMGNIVYRGPNGKLVRTRREMLDIVMIADPNSGELTAQDPAACAVTGYSPSGQVFVLDSWSKRCDPAEFIEKMFEMYQRWSPRVLGIEKAGQQSIKFWFKRRQKELGLYVNVVDVSPKNRKKTEKIRKALQPVVNLGKLFLRKSQANLRHQFQYHPDLENDDEIECVAYASELWRSPMSLSEQEEQEDAIEKVLQLRNPITGY